jgi:hypothetical protein
VRIHHFHPIQNKILYSTVPAHGYSQGAYIYRAVQRADVALIDKEREVDKERDFSCCCIFALLTTKFLRMFLHCNDEVVTIVYRMNACFWPI